MVGIRSAANIGAPSPFQLSEMLAYGHIQKLPMPVADYGLGATS